jgi:hypothetical protein
MKGGRTEPYVHFQHFCLDTQTRYNDGYSRLMFAFASALQNTGQPKPTYVQCIQFATKLYLKVTDNLGVCRLANLAPVRSESHSYENRASDTEPTPKLSKRQKRKERRTIRELFDLSKSEIDACYMSPAQHESEIELLNEDFDVFRSAPKLDPAPTVIDHTVQATSPKHGSSAQIDDPTDDSKSEDINSVSGECQLELDSDGVSQAGELPPSVKDLSPSANSNEQTPDQSGRSTPQVQSSGEEVESENLSFDDAAKIEFLETQQDCFSSYILENADASLLRDTYAERSRKSVIADLKRSVDALSISTSTSTIETMPHKARHRKCRRMKAFRAE